MRITDVEAIVLRRHEPARDISDGTQDALVVRITTDEGLVGIGEVDSSPEVVKAAIEAPKSHLTSCGLRQLLLGEDPCDVGRLWEKLYRTMATARPGVRQLFGWPGGGGPFCARCARSGARRFAGSPGRGRAGR